MRGKGRGQCIDSHRVAGVVRLLCAGVSRMSCILMRSPVRDLSVKLYQET